MLFLIFAYFMPSLTNPSYVCDLSFLKIILEVILMIFYIAKYTCYFWQFKNKMTAHFLTLGHPYISIFNLCLLF